MHPVTSGLFAPIDAPGLRIMFFGFVGGAGNLGQRTLSVASRAYGWQTEGATSYGYRVRSLDAIKAAAADRAAHTLARAGR